MKWTVDLSRITHSAAECYPGRHVNMQFYWHISWYGVELTPVSVARSFDVAQTSAVASVTDAVVVPPFGSHVVTLAAPVAQDSDTLGETGVGGGHTKSGLPA